MNFIVSTSSFLTALNQAAHAVNSSSPQPSLRCLKLSAENHALTVTGSDGDLSIKAVMNADEENRLHIIEEGEILIESRYLMEIVKKIDSNDVQVEILDGALTKFAGNSVVYKINGTQARDYPNIDFSVPENTLTMKAGLLAEIIEQTNFAAAVKETKPILMGVNFRCADGQLTCTATDSYRLARKIVPFESAAPFRLTIPSRALNEVKSVLLGNPDQEIIMAMSEKKATFKNDTLTMQTRLLDGAYPETDRLIPKEFEYKLSIDKMDLVRAIDRTTFIKSDNMAVNRLQCSANDIILTNKSQEIGEFRETLTGAFEGEELDISFSANYVMQAARAIPQERLEILFKGEMKPFIICSAEDDSLIQLVLPVRTYN